MRYKALLLLISALGTGVLACCQSAGAQGSRHFQGHALEPPPMPPREYLRQARFYHYSSRAVVTAFKDHGLEVADLKPGLTVGAPGAKESIIFLTPSFGKNIGVLVSSFSSDSNLQKSVQYYRNMNNKAASLSWRIMTKDNILLLISGKVPESAAKEYENVLAGMEEK